MDERTRKKSIAAIERALCYFRGSCLAENSEGMGSVLEDATVAMIRLVNAATRMDAMKLGYDAGKQDERRLQAYLLAKEAKTQQARVFDFPNIELGCVAEA